MLFCITTLYNLRLTLLVSCKLCKVVIQIRLEHTVIVLFDKRLLSGAYINLLMAHTMMTSATVLIQPLFHCVKGSHSRQWLLSIPNVYIPEADATIAEII